jgi:hypothetical protein
VKTADEILDHLRKGGFPLEYQTANALRQVGFRALQGTYYTDPLTEKNREADVVAPLPVVDAAQRIEVVVVAECKAGPQAKPWVAMTTRVRPEPTIPIAGRELESYFAEIRPDILPGRLPIRRPHGFAVMETFVDKGRNRAYDSMNQAVSAAMGVLAQWRTGRKVLVHPVVVTAEQLFRFEEEGEKVVPSGYERVVWHGAQAHPYPTLIDIVQSDSLAGYVAELRGEVQDLVTDMVGAQNI